MKEHSFKDLVGNQSGALRFLKGQKKQEPPSSPHQPLPADTHVNIEDCYQNTIDSGKLPTNGRAGAAGKNHYRVGSYIRDFQTTFREITTASEQVVKMAEELSILNNQLNDRFTIK